MNTELWLSILGAFAALAVVINIALLIALYRTKKQKQGAAVTADKIVTKKGVRYSADKKVTTAAGAPQVTHLLNDLTLQAGKVYHVGKKAKIKPGQYTILAADESTKEFKIRVGDVVKTYQHNCSIVLAENETISPRSSTIILR